MINDIPEYSIQIKNVTKIYKLYDKPTHRLKEALNPLSKSYHKDFYALQDFNLNIQKGETLGILGKNGAGKSTLLKIVTGVLNPTSGSVKVNGKIAALLELGAGFNPELTGLENIYFNGTIMGFSKDEMDERLESILSFADIGHFIHQPVKTYSSGMFARLAFAVAINVDPDILIVDEALSVGDVAFQTKCFRKFNDFKENGKTILFVSHSLDSILRYCNKAVVINDGKNIAEGTPKEMVDIFKKILVNLYDIQDDLKINKETKVSTIGEWKQYFSDNKSLLEYGDKQAEIFDYGIFDSAGNPTTKIISDEETVIKMRVKFHEEISEPIFAFTIKDLKGNELSGTNTLFENMNTDLCKDGDEIIVTFTQVLNLQSGVYTLSLGCTGYVGDDLKVFHRLYDVLSFETTRFKNIVGIYDLNSTIELVRG